MRPSGDARRTRRRVPFTIPQRRRWAFGPVAGAGGALGAVLVAFDMEPTNDNIRNKYLKGLGMVLFFVGLILFQNVTSRQDKLRLLDLERRYAEAKRAIRETLPGRVQVGELSAFGVLNQSQVGSTVCSSCFCRMLSRLTCSCSIPMGRGLRLQPLLFKFDECSSNDVKGVQ